MSFSKKKNRIGSIFRRNSNCANCKLQFVQRSGYVIKSPPVSQMAKSQFCNRWMTLSVVNLCENHAPSGKTSIVLSYYTNNEENDLKGSFEVNDAILEEVSSLPDIAPPKYRDRKYILKWKLEKYDRELYMILEDEKDMKAWEAAFEKLLCMFNISDDKESQKESCNISLQDILRHELSQNEPEMDEQNVFDAHLKPPTNQYHNNARDSGISSSSEMSNRSSRASCGNSSLHGGTFDKHN